MYNDYIKEKVSEKIEYDLNLARDYFIIYLNLLIKFSSDLEIRSKLKEFIKSYYKFSINEYKLLRYIKCLEDDETIEEVVCDTLEELENIYNRHHEYLEMVLNGYEEAIFYNDITRASFSSKNFDFKYLIKQQSVIKSKIKNERVYK